MSKKLLNKAFGIISENIILRILSLFFGVGIAGAIGNSIQLPFFLHIILVAFLASIFVCLISLFIFCIIVICLYMPKAVSWKNNIHRVEFVSVVFITNIIATFSRVLYEPEYFNLNFQPTIFVVLIGVAICFFMLYLEICAYIKRLDDLKWSKWLVLIALIPYICLFIAIPCTFMKSKKEDGVIDS